MTIYPHVDPSKPLMIVVDTSVLLHKLHQSTWLPVTGYEAKYLISSEGELKSINNLTSDGKMVKGRTISFIINPDGYAQSMLNINGSESCHRVHRLVATTFLSNPDNKPQVNHIDGNKLNNCVANLEWSTAKENTVHAHQLGLASSKGENNNLSKISELEAQYAIWWLAAGMQQETVAKALGIKQQTVSYIANGKTWKHLTR